LSNGGNRNVLASRAPQLPAVVAGGAALAVLLTAFRRAS
jgi:hypothetical protein